jgi:hypothetical protein
MYELRLIFDKKREKSLKKAKGNKDLEFGICTKDLREIKQCVYFVTGTLRGSRNDSVKHIPNIF